MKLKPHKVAIKRCPETIDPTQNSHNGRLLKSSSINDTICALIIHKEPRMHIFFTHATAHLMTETGADTKTLSRIRALLNDSTEITTSKQIELFPELTKTEGEFKFYWMAIRTSDAGRLIGCVVKNTTNKDRYFFALEHTETHDYRKTLVDNTLRLENWSQHMVDYLRSSLPSTVLHESTIDAAVIPTQRLVQHNGRFRAPDAIQSTLMDIPMHKGIVCFAPPGAGKTLLGVQRAIDYLGAGLKTVLLTPTKRLRDSMQEELLRQGFDCKTTESQCWSFDDFLEAMQGHYPALRLLHTPATDARQLVDLAYFKAWLTRTFKKQPTETQLSAHWQELHDILMQPNWETPDSPYLSKDTYCALGTGQSNILKEQRPELYDHVFLPFLRHISDTNQFYYPASIAQQLYHQLLTNPLPDSFTFDAIVLDEVQKFHPWEWACLLKLLKKPLPNGYFFISGDAHQGVECQQLHVAESLRRFFSAQHADFPVYHLYTNHRSAQAISRFVAKTHALELTLFGAMERATHLHMTANEHQAEGEVSLIPYTDRIRHQITHEVDAYVLIPDETCRENAEKYWSKGQIVTLAEFTGMSAKILVMFGFSTRFKSTLDHIFRQLTEGAKDMPLAWETSPAFARKAKGQGDGVTIQRACLQSFYTAASRAIETLIIVEPTGSPHPLCQAIYSQSTIARTDAKVGDHASAPTEIDKSSTPAQWFERAERDFKAGLKEQAIAILLREDLWGAEQVAAIRTLLEKPSDDPFQSIRALLFPSPPLMRDLSSVELSSTEKPPVEMPKSAIQPPTKPLELAKSDALPDKWVQWMIKLLEAPTKGNILALLGLKNSLLTQLLFHHTLASGHCLLVQLTSNGEEQTALFQKLLNQKPDVKANLSEAYATIEAPDILLQLSWIKVSNTTPEKLDELIKKVAKDPALLRALLKTPEGVLFFTLHWKSFSEKKLLTPDVMSSASEEGITPFYLLTTTNQGQILIKKHWAYFVSNGLLSPDSMHRPITGEGPNQGMTPFFILASTYEGQKLISDHWADFLSRGLLSPESMHRPITGEIPNKGITPFFILTSSPAGRQLISTNWEYFVSHDLISHVSMHRPITGESPDKGMTPFFYLASTPEGRQLICTHWKYFVSHDLISRDSMHRPITGESPDKGMTPFFGLACTPAGRQLISTHWDYFVSHGLISHVSMHKPPTGEGPYQGMTPFFGLASTPEGQQLISTHWDDFVSHGLLSPGSIYREVTGEGPCQGMIPFFSLACTHVGRQLISTHWDYFEKHALIERASMSLIIQNEGEFKGKTLRDVVRSISQNQQRLKEERHTMPTMSSLIDSFFTSHSDETEASRETGESMTPNI